MVVAVRQLFSRCCRRRTSLYCVDGERMLGGVCWYCMHWLVMLANGKPRLMPD